MWRFASLLFLFISTIALHSQTMDAELIKTFKIQENGIAYFTNGNPEKALPLLLESKKRLEKKLGNKHLAVAGTCYMLGGVYSSLENDKEALLHNEKALAIYEKTDHQYTPDLLFSVSIGYQKFGEHQKAIPLLLRLVDIREKKLKHEPAKIGQAVNMLATSLYKTNQREKALLLYEKGVTIFENAPRENDEILGDVYLNIGSAYLESQLYDNAIKYFSKANLIFDKNFIYNKLIDSCISLAYCLEKQSNFLKAKEALLKALNLSEKENLDKSVLALLYNNIGSLLSTLGEQKSALENFYKALSIKESIHGYNEFDISTTINNIALLQLRMGNFQEAIKLFEKSLSITERSNGHDHPETALSLNNLALGLEAAGEYNTANRYFKEAVSIYESKLGSNHIQSISAKNNLATNLFKQGKIADAITILEHSLAETREKHGEQNPPFQTTLNNLSSIYCDIGDYEKSIKLNEQSYTICIQLYGLNHPETARVLSNLAVSYSRNSQYNKAIEFDTLAYSVREKVLGSFHPSTAISLNNIGFCLLASNPQKAKEYIQKSLEIYKNIGMDLHADVAAPYCNLGIASLNVGEYQNAANYYLKGIEILDNSLGKENPRTIELVSDLASIYYLDSNNELAKKYSLLSLKSEASHFQKLLNMDENIKMSWQAKNSSFGILPCLLSPSEIAELLIGRKSIILDSTIEDRSLAKSTAEGQGLVQELITLKSKISRLAFSQDSENQKKADLLIANVAQIERELSKFGSASGRTRQSSQVKLENVVPVIPDGHALLDFVKFEDLKLPTNKQACYGAVILTHQNAPEFVRIDNLDEINNAIESMRQSITSGDSLSFHESTSLLSDKLWSPIANKLPCEIHSLHIAPEGKLNFLSFAALLDSADKFLGEKFDISYIGSARDLVRETSSTHSRSVRIFANPIFDFASQATQDNKYALRSTEIDVFGQVQLPPLPGTVRESSEIQKVAANSGWDLQTFTGEQADEATLRQTKMPGILHLATHGFYLNTFVPTPEGARGMSVAGLQKTVPAQQKGVDPMRASGIALTGAQSTLRSWAERKAPDPESDGILTAEEVAALDLQGTWIVSLSACETGVGEARSGEGVLGLRRSFMMAGAENLLMTLWPVSDQTTPEIMADFYREALKTRNAPGSLAKVQREWLVKLRKEKGLLEAVRDAGPFVMATIGKPLPPLPREPAKEPSILDKVTQKIESLIKSSNTDIKNN
jgi:tetratricopeptide (TPR) repeat protein